MILPPQVNIVEVGPRDGLQNETQTLSVGQRVDLIHQLSNCQLPVIEVGSFVSPKWVPQMANSSEVYQQLSRSATTTRYPLLVPNLRGLQDAIEAKVKDIAIFASASEAFSQKNLNCSIATSLQQFSEVCRLAAKEGIRVRGYVSCALNCPFEGKIAPQQVLAISQALLKMGCYEISLGDTTGKGGPGDTSALLKEILSIIPAHLIALHCHDTYGQALANVLVALQAGISTFDSSIAGLGGCPYAPGASGNVATEDLVYLLDSLGVKHPTSLQQLIKVNQHIETRLGLISRSHVANAMRAQHSEK